MTTILAKSKVLLSLLAAVTISLGWAETYDISPSGDASTDTTAINDAIQGAEENAVITLAPGTYKINATITIDRPVTVQGLDYTTCILDAETRAFSMVSINNAKATLYGVTIANGRLDGVFSGVGVAFGSNGGRLERCRVTQCVGSRFSNGAIDATHGAAKIYHCIVDNNKNSSTIGYQGGGALVSNAIFYDCLFYRNYAASGGGAVRATSGDSRFVNCTFANNSVADGKVGGGVSTDGNPVFVNCLAYGNVATSDTSTGGPDFYSTNYGTTKFIKCASLNKVNDISFALEGNPFKDSATDNYRLVAGCAAIDTGSTESASKVSGMPTIDNDLAGVARVMGEEIDIGAYEYDPNVATVQLEADRTSATVERGVTLSATVGGTEPEGGSFDWTLTPQNGAAVEKATGNPVVFKPLQYGKYDVKVVFTKASMEPTDEKIGYLFLGPATNYVSAVAVSGSLAPYTQPTTAATNVQDAIDVAADGTVVVLQDGTYNIDSTITIAKGVTLLGSGWDNCTFYGNKSISSFPNPLLTINNADAIVKGVHITHVYAGNNWTYGGSGVMIGGEGGTLAACRVSDCTDSYGTAGTRGAVSVGGLKAVVTRCLVENCVHNRNIYNTAGGIFMTAGRIDNCVIRKNSGGYSSGSGVTGGGGGIAATGGLVLNCTVVSNSCVDVTEHPDSAANIAAFGTVVVRNCLMQGQNVDYYGATGTACTYSLVSEGQTVPAGDGNFAGSVLFKNGGYVPRASSAVSRKGSAAGFEDVLVGAVDFYGKPRVRGDGSIDIGCAQANLNGLVLLVR